MTDESSILQQLKSLDGRQQRIEGKIDKVGDVLISIARVEVRMQDHLDKQSRLGERIGELENRVDELDKNNAVLSVLFSRGERFFWLIIAGIGSTMVAIGSAVVVYANKLFNLFD